MSRLILSTLPNEILLEIFLKLDFDSFYNMLATSKKMNFFITHWGNLIVRTLLLNAGIYEENIPDYKYVYDSLKSYRACLKTRDFSYIYINLDDYTHYCYTHRKQDIYNYNLNIGYLNELRKIKKLD